MKGLRASTMRNCRCLKTELQTYAALRGRTAVRQAHFLHDRALDTAGTSAKAVPGPDDTPHWPVPNSAGPDTPGGRRNLESSTNAGPCVPCSGDGDPGHVLCVECNEG